MEKKIKIQLVLMIVVLTIIFAVFGQYAGGALYFKLTSIPISYLELSSLLTNWTDYRDDKLVLPYISLGIILASVITLLPVFIITVALIATKEKEEIHGSARLANDTDLAKSGLFPTGKKRTPNIILGKMSKGRFKNRYIELCGELFAQVSAPTRSGKGIGIVITNLLTWWHSVVVVDIKYENLIKSAGYRKKFGQEVYLFSPDGFVEKDEDRSLEKVRTHRWNCFDYVRRSHTYRVSDVITIARALYPVTSSTTGADKFNWNKPATKLFMGLSLWMLDSEKITGIVPSLPYLYRLLGVEGGLLKWMKQEIKQPYVSDEVKMEFNACLSMAHETYASVEMNLTAPLDILSDKVVSYALSDSDFDFRELRKKKISLYVGCAPNKLPTFETLLNLFFEQLIIENSQTLPEQDPNLKYQCLLLLDEFTSLGRINQIEKGISYLAGYGLRFLLVYQDYEQMDHVYGKSSGKNIRKNHAVNVIYPPKEVDSYVRDISDTLGTKTVKTKHITKTISGGKTSKTVSPKEEKRALLMPHEIVELGFEKHPSAKKVGLNILILAENQRPFVAKKAIYFDDPELLERCHYAMNNIPEIPLLSLNG